MISFEIPEYVRQQNDQIRMVAESQMRPIARHYDEHEHERPTAFNEFMWQVMAMQQQMAAQRRAQREAEGAPRPKRPSTTNLRQLFMFEIMSWGDAALLLTIPMPGLGGAAIEAVGTPEQKERFLNHFYEGDMKWGAMAITEPGAGSDTANIQTTAAYDAETNEWVLNGEKIFITAGKMAGEMPGSFVVVWATVDKSAGRAGIKSFIVPAGTPGFTVAKVEHKLGIRASDTAALVFENCRIPYENILGSPEVQDATETRGFKGVMKTFDASRPVVAGGALGIARATIEFVKEKLDEAGVAIRYGLPRHKLTALERDFMDMEAQHKAAWLLTLRAVWMLDNERPNTLEAAMCKAKAGLAVTRITQKAVEMLGPMGYSRQWLVEKWMRDAKINDIYEGTGQINMLIVARRIFGYSSRELK
ncbi:MAG: acyl-CoA dehydrogenase family protein [Anaerolineae bacterium]|nr:acyl-CoA dehydrogenase family protein [Anaerolineae bacterium]